MEFDLKLKALFNLYLEGQITAEVFLKEVEGHHAHKIGNLQMVANLRGQILEMYKEKDKKAA